MSSVKLIIVAAFAILATASAFPAETLKSSRVDGSTSAAATSLDKAEPLGKSSKGTKDLEGSETYYSGYGYGGWGGWSGSWGYGYPYSYSYWGPSYWGGYYNYPYYKYGYGWPYYSSYYDGWW